MKFSRDQLRLLKNAGLLKEDVNPYAVSTDPWWYEDDEGYGIDWDGIKEAIKHATKKTVGDDYDAVVKFTSLWYNLLDNLVENAAQNIEDWDDDDEVYDTTRSEIEYYTDPNNWSHAEEAFYDVLSDQIFSDRLDRKKGIDTKLPPLGTLKKIGGILYAALMTNTKPSF